MKNQRAFPTPWPKVHRQPVAVPGYKSVSLAPGTKGNEDVLTKGQTSPLKATPDGKEIVVQ